MEFLDALEMLKIDSEVLFRRFSGNKGLAERFIRKFRDEKTFMELKKAYEAYQKGCELLNKVQNSSDIKKEMWKKTKKHVKSR